MSVHGDLRRSTGSGRRDPRLPPPALNEKPPRFEDVWPDVCRRGQAILRRRGVGAAAAEDALQEAAARALERQVPFTDGDALLRWVATVAWRVAVDAHRREQRLRYEVPDRLSPVDIDAEAETRRRLRALVQCVRGLNQHQRELLDPVASATSDRKVAAVRAVQRHRLRALLRTMVDDLAGALIAVLGVWRQCPRGSKRAAAVVAAAAVPLMALTVLHLPYHAERDAGEQPRSREPGAPARATSAPVSTPVPPAVDDAAPRVGVSAGRAPGDESTGPRSPLPAFSVEIPAPHRPGSVWGRPKEADDHFVCVDLVVLAEVCLDLPVRITGVAR